MCAASKNCPFLISYLFLLKNCPIRSNISKAGLASSKITSGKTFI